MLETLRQCRLIVYGIIADNATARWLLAEGLQATFLGKELTVARQQVFTSTTRKRMRTSAQTRCPFCAERIASDLHVCPFCESNLAPRRSRVTLVKPERSARAAVITSSIGIAFLLGVALLHSLHETRPSARIPNQSVASAATPVRHKQPRTSFFRKGGNTTLPRMAHTNWSIKTFRTEEMLWRGLGLPGRRCSKSRRPEH